MSSLDNDEATSTVFSQHGNFYINLSYLRIVLKCTIFNIKYEIVNQIYIGVMIVLLLTVEICIEYQMSG